VISSRKCTALGLLLGLACSGQNEEIEKDTVDDPSSDSAALDSGTGDSSEPSYSLVLGEAPPDFTLTDSNPASMTYDQPVTVSDKTGFVTGWYFFKSS
jgi:hypothetical protein